jgi:hypothetical protein
MVATKTRRVVASALEWRTAGDVVTAEGYASTFGQPYDMGWYTETVRSGAFSKTLSESPDVRFLINHEGLPLARTKSGTLEVSQDSTGLHTRARLDPSDPDVQRLLPKVQRGDIDAMSFGFRTIRDEWSSDYEQREMVELSLANGDVSAVTYPANPATSFGMRMRSFAESNPEQVRAAYKALREEREGKTISSATRDQLVSLLESMDSINDGIETASDELDGAFDVLNGLLGVEVPDPDDDTDESDDAGRSAAAPEETRGLHPSVLRARSALALLRR